MQTPQQTLQLPVLRVHLRVASLDLAFFVERRRRRKKPRLQLQQSLPERGRVGLSDRLDGLAEDNARVSDVAELEEEVDHVHDVGLVDGLAREEQEAEAQNRQSGLGLMIHVLFEASCA